MKIMSKFLIMQFFSGHPVGRLALELKISLSYPYKVGKATMATSLSEIILIEKIILFMSVPGESKTDFDPSSKNQDCLF